MYYDPLKACRVSRDLDIPRTNFALGYQVDYGCCVFIGPHNGLNAYTVYGVYVCKSIPFVRGKYQFTKKAEFVRAASLVGWMRGTMEAVDAEFW